MMRRTLTISLVLLIGVGVAGLAIASPQDAATQSAARPQAQNEFLPLKDLPKQEQLPAAPLVMGAYAFVWVALLVYVWSLWRRVGAVQRELTDLRRRTERRA